jgi:glutamate/tyrosine decarboxylase-like PLP-dependent enzyme
LFETSAPVPLNIVCFSLKTSNHSEWNNRIVIDLQERGVAAPSMTMLHGRAVMRAAIVNHRTTEEDMDTFVAELRNSALRVASAELSAPGARQLDLAATGS